MNFNLFYLVSDIDNNNGGDIAKWALEIFLLDSSRALFINKVTFYARNFLVRSSTTTTTTTTTASRLAYPQKTSTLPAT